MSRGSQGLQAPQAAQALPSGSASAGRGIDASVKVPWVFADEATPFTKDLLDTLGEQVMWAPTLWVFECANVLQSAQPRRRIDAHRRAEIASELSTLPVRLDSEIPNFVNLDRLAAAHGLGACDAAYAEFALRRSLPLVSLDARLIAATRGLGHRVLSATSDVRN